jgi:uncharacterized protein (TIGR02001 family)
MTIPWGLWGRVRSSLIGLFTLGAASPGLVCASEIGASVTAVSDYDYRGVSQTANKPALQMAAEYTAEPLHVEIWSSNVQFGPESGAYEAGFLEVAYSADLTLNRDGKTRYNFGINYASYPGMHPGSDYAEIWCTVVHGPLSASLHYSWDYSDVHPRLAAYYTELNGTWPLQGRISAVAHLGLSSGPYWNATNNGKYVDYALGLTGNWRRVTLLVEGIDTHGYEAISRGRAFSGTGKILASIAVAFSSGSD